MNDLMALPFRTHPKRFNDRLSGHVYRCNRTNEHCRRKVTHVCFRCRWLSKQWRPGGTSDKRMPRAGKKKRHRWKRIFAATRRRLSEKGCTHVVAGCIVRDRECVCVCVGQRVNGRKRRRRRRPDRKVASSKNRTSLPWRPSHRAHCSCESKENTLRHNIHIPRNVCTYIYFSIVVGLFFLCVCVCSSANDVLLLPDIEMNGALWWHCHTLGLSCGCVCQK